MNWKQIASFFQSPLCDVTKSDGCVVY